MKECGFPDVLSESHSYLHDKEGYAQSSLCMERKGYREEAVSRGICRVDYFKNTEACQKHLSQKQISKNQR